MNTPRVPPTLPEAWVSGGTDQTLHDMLLYVGQLHNCTVWLNGKKLHQAKEEPCTTLPDSASDSPSESSS